MAELAQEKQETAQVVVPEPTRGGATFRPRADILETDSELLLFADVPGVRPEDLDVCYEHGELTIHGKVQPRNENADYIWSEYEVGDWYRAFRLGEEIDASKIFAELKNGVLTLQMPKVAAAQPKRIEVKAS